jgi:MFS family permease
MEMIEAGKIGTEEGSELLDAMGRSSALRGAEKFSRTDIVMLVGAAMVILGFFLPWAYVPAGRVLDIFGRATAYQAGYHVRAIGWAVFIIAILSAVPVFVTPRNFLYKISMLQIFLILVGLVLVVSVLIRVGENVGAGLIFCLVGFIVELLSSGAKLKSLAA